MKVKRRKFGEDNVIRTETGEILILPSYNPDNPYLYYQQEYFWPREDDFDYYDPISGQISLMDGMILGEGKFSEAIEQGIVTQEEIDWVGSHSKWILYGLIGLGILIVLRSKRREIMAVPVGA